MSTIEERQKSLIDGFRMGLEIERDLKESQKSTGVTTVHGTEWPHQIYRCKNEVKTYPSGRPLMFPRECGNSHFQHLLVDESEHFIMRCVACGWVSKKMYHLPTDAPLMKWKMGSTEIGNPTAEITIDADGKIIVEAEDMRGVQCDEKIPALAKELGEIDEER